MGLCLQDAELGKKALFKIKRDRDAIKLWIEHAESFMLSHDDIERLIRFLNRLRLKG